MFNVGKGERLIIDGVTVNNIKIEKLFEQEQKQQELEAEQQLKESEQMQIKKNNTQNIEEVPIINTSSVSHFIVNGTLDISNVDYEERRKNKICS